MLMSLSFIGFVYPSFSMICLGHFLFDSDRLICCLEAVSLKVMFTVFLLILTPITELKSDPGSNTGR
jgi:hypothetical protein